ncbi:MAG: toll/interleukin-1 receptor domain-containing protein [Clostridia bacterium]|nr:toll/interleukin-1 receptor domain-containing protein [Clostridia bacterium]
MKKPYVFISYSIKDTDAANLVYNYLEGNGIPCWIASHNIKGGDSFAAEIFDAISNCFACVLIASKNSSESEHVNSELSLAFSQAKIILPLRISDYELSKSHKYFLERTRWFDGSEDIDTALKSLLNTLQNFED